MSIYFFLAKIRTDPSRQIFAGISKQKSPENRGLPSEATAPAAAVEDSLTQKA